MIDHDHKTHYNHLQVLNGDALSQLKLLSDESVDCCITSPPYFGLRDYGVGGQIGLESSLEDYLAALVCVFNEVHRVLKSDGTLWLNIGDTYSGNSTYGEGGSDKQKSNKRASLNKTTKRNDGVPPKNLIGVPWRLAFALRDSGWILRQDIIWHKPNAMPESVKDRCTKSHEYVFLFSKSPKYFYNNDAIKEPAKAKCAGDYDGGAQKNHRGESINQGRNYRKSGNKSHKYVTQYNNEQSEQHRTKSGLLKISDIEWQYRNKRSVWEIPTQPTRDTHFATMPIKLADLCVKAGCPPNGVALDPFAGTFTTAIAALDNGNRAIMIELNPEYIDIGYSRVAKFKQNKKPDHSKNKTYTNRVSNFFQPMCTTKIEQT